MKKPVKKPDRTPPYQPLVEFMEHTNGKIVVTKDTRGSLVAIEELGNGVVLPAYRLTQLMAVAKFYEEDARARGENFGMGTGLYGQLDALKKEIAEMQRKISSLLLSVDRLDAKMPLFGWKHNKPTE